jgi:hypothetical protein
LDLAEQLAFRLKEVADERDDAYAKNLLLQNKISTLRELIRVASEEQTSWQNEQDQLLLEV